MNDYQTKVQRSLTTRDLLEQLAEEAAELSQAALKLIRALELGKNVTLTAPDVAMCNLKEEIGDVLMVAELLLLVPGLSTKDNPKWKRWAERLSGGTEK
jgi:NTP pyrophosphatase (non-canonical NTP hydrolase)